VARTPVRSITVPLVLGVLAEALTITMLVGWIVVLVQNRAVTEQVGANTWWMAGGIVSLVAIGTVLVLFSVFLVREIRTVRQQVSFIDSVTHELKTPLAGMKLCVETLDRRALSEAQRAELHRMMLDDIDRLSAFIDDVLEASRAGPTGDRPFEVVSVAAVVERACERVRQAGGGEGLRVELPDGLLLHSDPTSLEVILRNLIDNAVKYSDPPVDVCVSVAPGPRDGTLDFRVQDRGIGIPKGQLKRIFERFYRAPFERVRARRGTGLGLYVAAVLVRGLGGVLRADSPGPGRGTTMSFTLPVARSERGRRAIAAFRGSIAP